MSAQLPSDEVAEDYKSSLEDLIDNARLVINNLTVIAKENIEHALAISRVLENHIKSTPPNRKLPALYLLDSIVKNVGTPYTLFLSRNLYSTFMNAYALVSAPIRQKLDEMLQTWKMPNPGSLDTKPVFPPEVTQPIETALRMARSAAFEQQQQHSLRAQQENLARGQSHTPVNGNFRGTATPPQMFNPHGAPTAQQHQPNTSYGQQIPQGYSSRLQPSAYQSPSVNGYHARQDVLRPSPTLTNTVDLPQLHKDIMDLVGATQRDASTRPYDASLQGRLDALLALQSILQQHHHPPDQLQQVRAQVTQLQTSAAPHQSPIPLSFPTDLASSAGTAAPQTSASHGPPSGLQSLLTSGNLAEVIARAQQSNSGAVATPPVSQPAIAFPPPPSSSSPVAGGVSDLLASLRSAGIVSSGTSSSSPLQQVPSLPSGLPNVSQAGRNVPLDSASLKIRRPELIASLYSQQPNQCMTCGRRFAATEDGREKKQRHYDWHFQTNKRMNDAANRAHNRSWYVDELSWIRTHDDPEADEDNAASGTKDGQLGGKGPSDPKTQYVPVPADTILANQPCPICQERFVASFNDTVSDWVWMDAVQVGNRIFHASCRNEMKAVGSRDATPARIATPDSVLGKRKAVNHNL